ncbi:MAG: adenosylcobinamide-GDP ribazoletransferase [Anaerolineae bacterium]
MIHLLARETRLFFTALMFFTRLPIPNWVGYRREYLNHSSRYFPLVGVLVGAIGAATFWLAQWAFPLLIAVLLSMVATIVVTGAFHEDGLADSCDAFGGGWQKEQVLTIMKDSRIGTFGAVGLGLTLALKFFALTGMPPGLLPPALVAGHSLSRFASTTLIYTQQYVRHEGSKSKPLAHKMSLPELIAAGLFGLLPLLLLPGLMWAAAVPVFLVRWPVGRYFVRRIGGYTGDCLGAMQ